MPRAGIGFTVKSGWASVVLVAGAAERPSVIDSQRIELSDPAIPDTRQPYHAGFGTARAAGAQRSRLLATVKRCGRRSVAAVIRQHASLGYRITGAGLVVGSLIDPDEIANDHIRIHALEGQLFREIVRSAAERAKVRCRIWRERDLYGYASGVLKQPEPRVRATVGALGRDVGGPWRAEQKSAALAAWLVLAQRR